MPAATCKAILDLYRINRLTLPRTFQLLRALEHPIILAALEHEAHAETAKRIYLIVGARCRRAGADDAFKDLEREQLRDLLLTLA